MELEVPSVPENMYIVVEENGPFLVHGNPPIHQNIVACNEDGEPWQYNEGSEFAAKECEALCRCGHSKNKPYCDSTHKHVKWDGSLTAPVKFPLDEAEIIKGIDLILSDNEEYCSYSRFCDAKEQIWNLVEDAETDEEKKLTLREAAHCPSGRLIVWSRKTGKPLEPFFKPAIGIIEDAPLEVSGPLWARGGIPIKKEDGTPYTVRNRVALCRCGKSLNKPFCNGSHAQINFQDNLPLEPNGKHF